MGAPIARGPLAGLTLTARGEAVLLLAGSALGAAALLLFFTVVPALVEMIAK
ncbi:hypothetical protein SEA_ALTADENA_35 [Arthrobacter phage Altadena]|uniref:Uncharacterized protein n=1 Tax=Arthrobacter phage Altadena TaxID=3059064 RepID=A0AA96HTM7_9CAUD|nr:hypothetical protein SEA_ALTADENA_35 [Arthrobacter phage Altadena]